ncbi:hypothetical protein BIV57_12775 [Mangrovactinospora gilvigrisea]|uniref:Uncharacterized protein n=1 Tax=Mangrovactinospora gilvigrisea TaxID=1428644 RepID=A0A1J7BEJ9_9ACTN|nr:hypothetical protein BIV57_12775 [Mangrovactinospora gilvigrisea]
MVIVGIILAIVIPMSINSESKKTYKIHYEVTGTATHAVISYSKWDKDNWSTSQTTVDKLPWTRTETATGLVKGGDLSVTLGAGGGSAKCSVTVNKGTPKTANASGAFASASCNGFGS